MDIFTYLTTHFSIFGFMLVAMVGNAFPGVPEEIFLLSLGYLGATVGFGAVNFPIVAAMLIVGFVLVDSGVYLLSKHQNKLMVKFANTLLGKWFNPDAKFIETNMKQIIVISRFVPQFRFVGPYFSGLYKFPYKKFLLLDVLALCVYVPFYLGIGAYFQDRINQIKGGVSLISNIIESIVFILIVIVILRWLFNYFKKKYNKEYKSEFFGFTRLKETEDEQKSDKTVVE